MESFDAKIGIVQQKGNSIDRFQWKKGDDLLGFAIPYNCNGSLQEIFNRFQLWQNRNGICVDGINHDEPFDDGTRVIFKQIDHNRFISKIPFYVGDSVRKKTIIECNNTYNEKTQHWYCRVIFGNLPGACNLLKEGEDPPVLEHLKNLEVLLETIVTSTAQLLTDFEEKILTATTANHAPVGVTITPGSPPVTLPFISTSFTPPPGVLKTLIENYKNSLKESFEKIKESIIC